MHISTIDTVDIFNHDKQRPLSSYTSLVCLPLRAAVMLRDALTRVNASSVAPVGRGTDVRNQSYEYPQISDTIRARNKDEIRSFLCL